MGGGRKGRKGRKRERDVFLSTSSLPRWPQQPEPDQANTSSLQVHSGLQMPHRGPCTWGILFCFQRCICRELDLEAKQLEPDSMASILDG